jgi:hypothetical protein
MLKAETKKKNQLKKNIKKQPKLIRQTYNPGHKIEITL